VEVKAGRAASWACVMCWKGVSQGGKQDAHHRPGDDATDPACISGGIALRRTLEDVFDLPDQMSEEYVGAPSRRDGAGKR